MIFHFSNSHQKNFFKTRDRLTKKRTDRHYPDIANIANIAGTITIAEPNQVAI